MNASVSPAAPRARGGRSLLVWGVSLSAVLLAVGLIAWRYMLRPDPSCIEYPMLRTSDMPTVRWKTGSVRWVTAGQPHWCR